MQIVNGYPCASCTDVSFAKRGVDPKDPTGEKAKALKAETEGASATDLTGGAPTDPAKETSRAGAAGAATDGLDPFGASSRARPPAAAGQPGSVLDIAV